MKPPPCSVPDEKAVLTIILSSPTPDDFINQLAPSLFHDHRHRALFDLILACQRSGSVNATTVREAIVQAKAEPRCGGWDYVSSLIDANVFTWTFEDNLRILKEQAIRRSAIDDARSLALIAQDTAVDAAAIRSHAQRLAKSYADALSDEIPILARPVGEFDPPPENDPSELIRFRYLCKRGSLQITGPTGVGKSSFLLQMLACFANNLPFFGITPTRMLSSVLIQAENDDGDIAEMRNGICTGLSFNETQRKHFFGIVRVHTSTGITGRQFCSEVVRPLLASHKPDILAIDPALSFLGGDVKEQKDVGNFLRQYLNPEIFAHDCSCIISHHTNKPKSGKDDNAPQNGDWAYQGSGSAEWANWARAVLSLQSCGEPGVYKLHAGKRGSRLGWRDDEDNIQFEKIILHSKEKGSICWLEGTEDDLPASNGRPKTYEDADLIELLGSAGLSTNDWCDSARSELGLSRATFHRAKTELNESGLVLKSKINQRWLKVGK